eukprot:gene11746-24631_t
MIRIKLINKASGEIELPKDASVADVKERIFQCSGIAPDRVKLLISGKVVNDDNMRVNDWNGKKLMVLLKPDTSEIDRMNEINKDMEAKRKVDSINDAAIKISSMDQDRIDLDPSELSFGLYNQNGDLIDLPPNEKEGLIQGMILQDHGRAEMRKYDGTSSDPTKIYGAALQYFILAETSYKKCRQEIMMGSDNFPILCLDISWCLFSTNNLTDISRFSELLSCARQGFTNAHGPNLERLFALKGRLCAERVLYVRLQLLEGVLKVLQQDYNGAMGVLLFARHNCAELAVDSQQVDLVMLQFQDYDLSFPLTRTLAIRAIRAARNDVAEAIDFIFHRDFKEKQIRAEDARRLQERARLRSLGTTIDGSKVNLQLLDSLIAAGFEECAVASACVEFNNNEEFVLFALNPASRVCVPAYKYVRDLCDMGFDREGTRNTLRSLGNDFNAAVECLRSQQRDMTCISPSATEPTAQITMSPPSANTRANASDEFDEQESNRATVAMNEIRHAHQTDEESHLDLDLEEEAQAILLYIAIASEHLG